LPPLAAPADDTCDTCDTCRRLLEAADDPAPRFPATTYGPGTNTPRHLAFFVDAPPDAAAPSAPPPRPDTTGWRCLGVQRFVAGLGAVVAEARARPPSFLRLVRAGLVPGSEGRVAEHEGELFLGVTAFECVRAHTAAGQRLPFDVWLTVARFVATTLADVASDDPLWTLWSGPRGFGVTSDGRLVVFEGADGSPLRWHGQREWTQAPAELSPEARRARAVAVALAWLLEGWTTEGERTGTPWDGQLHHPDADADTERALLGAISGASSLPELAAQLVALDRPSAQAARVRDVFLGATDALRSRAKELERRVRRWPPEWQRGGLAVALDEALEHGLPPSGSEPAPPVKAVRGRTVALPQTGFLEVVIERERPGGLVRLWEGRSWWGPTLPDRFEWPPRLRAVPEPGTRVMLTLRHPAHQQVAARLEGVQGADGHLRLVPPRERGALDALLASQTLTDEAVRPPGPLAAGRWPWLHAGVMAVTALALGFTSAKTVDGAGWYVAWALLTLVALLPATALLALWPFGRWTSVLLLGGTGWWLASYARAESDRAAWGLVPLLGLLIAGLLTRPRHRHSWFHAAREWRRAAESPDASPCIRCGRRHPAGAWYEECQYASCRAPLRPGEGCRCAACEDAEFEYSARTPDEGATINRD
jgi:hypothetical protein